MGMPIVEVMVAIVNLGEGGLAEETALSSMRGFSLWKAMKKE